MTFLVPSALWGLLVVPMLVIVYGLVVRHRRARRPAALRVVTTDDGRGAGPRRRHLPMALFLLALAALLFSFARPEANLTLPTRAGQIVLVFDTSNSMVANDVAADGAAGLTRLDQAKSVAVGVVDRQPGSIEIGVVAFTDGGLVVQPPTKRQQDVRAAIDRLAADGGTSISEGIFAALTAISEEPIELDTAVGSSIADIDIGFFSNAAIIVFTDGEDTGGPSPVEFASLASNSGVPVYTVGVGSRRGTVIDLDGFSIATALDETLLAEIAESTDGEYLLAADDPELTGIFDEIDRSFERRGERIEITALLAMAAAALTAMATALSIRWHGRL